MKRFLNVVAGMLMIAWVILYFIEPVGPVAHIMLLLAVVILLANKIRTRFRASFPYYTSDSRKQ